jgi:UDP-N-acetylmuramoyl-tripeptide--D-alanyl-D-alanine ligase
MVLGDMGELGPDERSLHRAAGAAARRGGVNRLFTIGVLAAEAALAFGEDAAHFMDLETLAAVLEGELEPDVTLLVKGSRAMQLDLLVARLQQAGEATC